MIKKALVWTDTCKAKSFTGFDRITCGSYISKGRKLCDFHLLEKFDLNARYDSEDNLGMSPLYEEDAVVAALRKATKL